MKRFLFAFAATLVSLTVLAQNRDDIFVLPVANNEIKVMQYNVENLFNTIPNPGKEDWTFLPAGHPAKANCVRLPAGFRRDECQNTDWTPEKLKIKLAHIGQVLAAQGALPDIVALEEVEGEDLVQFMAREFGFDGYVFFDGPDVRGIDTALLYRRRALDLISQASLDVSVPKFGPTRNILRADFLLKNSTNKEILSVYVNHWPSQANPTDYRLFVAEQLTKDIAAITQKAQGRLHVIAIGDFNTIDGEKPNPLYNFIANPKWPLALVDLNAMSDRLPNPYINQMPPGTEWYAHGSVWNRLDKAFLSKNFFDKKGLEVEIESFRIQSPSFMLRKDRQTGKDIPFRYNFNTTDARLAGYADHLPIVFKLKFQ